MGGGKSSSHQDLSKEEIRSLKRAFKAKGTFHRTISYDKFAEILCKIDPNLSDNDLEQSAQYAFNTADQNKDKTLNFDEFVNAYKLHYILIYRSLFL